MPGNLACYKNGVASEVGLKSPIIMLLAFIPMLFISYAYKALNKASPDCGTSFTWVFGIGSIAYVISLAWRRSRN